MLKLVLYEDDHLLVVNKPAGWNTHAPGPYAGEGLFEWLRDREPRWANLALIHRLDKETSGLMVFGKTRQANQSLTNQFARRQVRKTYLLLTDRPVPAREITVTSCMIRAGERYLSRPLHSGHEPAITKFKIPKTDRRGALIEAEPVTGRTHQVRVHAAAQGWPILGDTLYGGTPASRLCLHAARLAFKHPVNSRAMRFEVTPDFDTDASLAFRQAILDPDETNACRLIHGAGDGWPGWYVDRLAGHILAQSEAALTAPQEQRLRDLQHDAGVQAAVYHKRLDRQVRRLSASQAGPRLLLGSEITGSWTVRENALTFEVSFQEGYSVGLFLDQRDNRRRLLTQHVAAGFPLFLKAVPGPTLLNTFAYTSAFSACAARAGLRTTSLDLSNKYLEWGRRNFVLNGLRPDEHEFLRGDVFDWLRRFHKQERRFDVIVLDPPAFSHSKGQGLFRAEKDYPRLVGAALPLLTAQGVLLASTNVARYAPADFLADVREAVRAAGRTILQEHFAPAPPDFPVSRAEPAQLKTVWLRLA